ncbi:MAG TPA: hypothetical protein VIJ93_03455, partial [bacterium]
MKKAVIKTINQAHLSRILRGWFTTGLTLFSVGLTAQAEAQCSISSAQICVGADDYAVVWVNGFSIAVSMAGVTYNGGQPVPCVIVPAADLIVGTNVIAIQTYNTACCYNWATWSLGVNLSNGSTAYITSSSGNVQIWNQPTANGPPPPNDSGSVTWWNSSYNSGSVLGWGAPVSVTYPNAFYDLSANNPIGGGLLSPLGADLDGGNGTSNSGTFNGQAANASIYYRQTFNLTTACPTTTPVPNLTISKSLLGPSSGVSSGQLVTYVVNTCNSGGPVSGPVTVGDSLYNTSSGGGFGETNIWYKKWFDGTTGSGIFTNPPDGPNLYGSGSALTWVYPIGFPGYGFCDSVTIETVDWFIPPTGGPCVVSNDAVLTQAGSGPLTSNTTSFTTNSVCIGTPTNTPAPPTNTPTPTPTVT